MRILVVTTKSPYPLYEGRALRTYNLLRQAARSHEILLLTFVQTAEESAGIEHLKTFCSHVEAVRLHYGGGRLRIAADMLRELFGAAPIHAVKYRNSAMRGKFSAIVAAGGVDLVHLDMLHLGEFLDLCGGIPVVLVQHNVESLLLRRRADGAANPFVKAYLGYQYRKLRAFEEEICRRVDHVVSVSDLDADLLREFADGTPVTVISNGVDTGYFAPAARPRQPDELVFVGGMSWFPNLDAMRYFCGTVLPLIAEQVPGVHLTIVGRNPDDADVRAIASNPRIRLAGLVEDVRPLVTQAAAYVVPLRIGGGTRLKILDALSMGTPLVSTSIGCEGLAVEDGTHLLVADEPTHFADAVVRVLRDPGLGRRLGAAGRDLAVRQYDWSVIAPELERVYRECVARAARRPASR